MDHAILTENQIFDAGPCGDLAPVARPSRGAATPCWLLLAALLAIGGVLRFHGIGDESLWIDEFWAADLATGNGNAALDAPFNVVMNPPPATFQRARPAWHIWSGLQSVVHPPMYYLVLRGWADLFGGGDLALRSLSAVCSLAGVVVLFDVLRRTSEMWVASFAAAFMTFAPAQIDYSQEVRPYTLLVLLALLCCWQIVQIQIHGPSRWRCLGLGAFVAALLLTHYFALGAVAGLTVYAATSAKCRKRLLLSIALASMFVLASWGPFAFQQRHVSQVPDYMRDARLGLIDVLKQVVLTPHRLVLAPLHHITWEAAIPLAILTYLVPLMIWRKRPSVRMWWWLAMGSVGFVAAIDALRHSLMLSVVRYGFLAAPAVYALLAQPLPLRGRIRWVGAPIILICVMIYGVDRSMVGGQTKENLRALSHDVDALAGPNDILAFAVNWDMPGQQSYLAFAHYVPQSRRRVIFLKDRPPDAVLRRLARGPRIWVLGANPATDTQKLFPGWRYGPGRGVMSGLTTWPVYPPVTSGGAVPSDTTRNR